MGISHSTFQSMESADIVKCNTHSLDYLHFWDWGESHVIEGDSVVILLNPQDLWQCWENNLLGIGRLFTSSRTSLLIQLYEELSFHNPHPKTSLGLELSCMTGGAGGGLTVTNANPPLKTYSDQTLNCYRKLQNKV